MAKKQPTSLRPVHAILANGRQAELLGQNKAHSRILETVRELLPDNFNVHCVSAQMLDNSLIVHVDTSTWATKLRFQLPAILPALQRQPGLHSISKCDVRIQPGQPANSSPGSHSRQIDEQTAQQIRELACVISDENLRKRWLKIAENTATTPQPEEPATTNEF